MLKYVDAKITFSEIPDEITLCINISNCPCHCKGCHSSYLSENIGTKFDKDELIKLLINNIGITCISFMGGDSDPIYINWLANSIRKMNNGEPNNFANVKIAWYSGRSEISKDIELKNFDYIKIGPYIEELGPLNSKTTNQKMYKVFKDKYEDGTFGYELEDITYKFWK